MAPEPTDIGRPEESRYWVKSVARAIDVLELLAAQPAGARLSVTEIAARLGLSKSAVFATLYTLNERHFVADEGTGMSRRYRLGMALARLGSHAAVEVSLRDVARPHLLVLARESGGVARLAILESGHAVVIDQVGGGDVRRADLRMGTRELPHSTGLGKAILAALPADEARRLIDEVGLPQRTGHTITEVTSLLAHLAEIREAGYAIDDEEDAEGVFCIGAPVRGHEGTCVGAISITGLKPDQPAWRYQELGRLVRDSARRVSADLGYVED